MSDQARTTDKVNDGTQKSGDRLEKPPDALPTRNASGADKKAALDAFTDKYESMNDLKAIPGGESFGIRYEDGSCETSPPKNQRQSDRRQISEDEHPIRIIPAISPEADARIKAEKQSKHEQISESATHMALAAQHDPTNQAMEIVARTRAFADGLPGSDPRKVELTNLTREQAVALSPEMQAYYDRQHQQPMTPKEVAGLPSNTANKTADGWLLKINAAENVISNQEETSIIEQVAALPLDKQAQVIGAGLLAYQEEMSRQQFQIMVGTIAGIGDGAVSLAKGAEETAKTLGDVWHFSKEIMLNDPAAIEKSAKAGEAIGKTLVGGVRLWQVSDAYLRDVGATGDYSKPFKDITWLGEQLDQRWNAMTPAEQSKLTAKLSTEYLGGLALGLGVSKFANSEKITGALEELGTAASELGGKSKEKAGKFISGLLDEIMPQPVAVTPDGQRIPIPRQRRDNYLMSKADDIGETQRKPHDGGRERGSIPEKLLPSDRFVAELKLVTDGLSEGERTFLQKHGIEIKAVRRMDDVPEATEKLAGGYRAADKTIYVPEEVFQNGQWVKNPDVPFILRHEYGHALNAQAHPFGEPLSDAREFIDAFNEDFKAVPTDIRDTLQLSEKFKTIVGARDEVFADLWAHSTGEISNNPYSKMMKKHFPTVLQFFERKQ